MQPVVHLQNRRVLNGRLLSKMAVLQTNSKAIQNSCYLEIKAHLSRPLSWFSLLPPTLALQVYICTEKYSKITFKSLWTISCWWIWLTLSNIWWMQWLQNRKGKYVICYWFIYWTCTSTSQLRLARLPPPPQVRAVGPRFNIQNTTSN